YDEASRRTLEQWQNHKNAPAFLATLDAMQRLAREKQLSLTLAIMPSKEEVYRWMLEPSAGAGDVPRSSVRFLTAVARERGIPVVDLGPELTKQGRELAA